MPRRGKIVSSWGGIVPQTKSHLELLDLVAPGAVDWDLDAVNGLLQYFDSSDGVKATNYCALVV